MLEIVNLRCGFCNTTGFDHLDSVYSHQMIITNEGHPICPKLKEWKARTDSQIFELPRKWGDFKYAPKDHSGYFIVYTSKGELAKDPKKNGENQLIRHLLHSPIPIFQEKNI